MNDRSRMAAMVSLPTLLLVVMIGTILIGLLNYQLPGAGPNLTATSPVTTEEAKQAQSDAIKEADRRLNAADIRRKYKVGDIVEATPSTVLGSSAIKTSDKNSKLVVEKIEVDDGQMIYCVHWRSGTLGNQATELSCMMRGK